MGQTSGDTERQSERSSGYTTVFESAEDASVCVAIVEAVSAVIGTEPTRLDPLYDVVDTDALERLIETGGTNVEVTFSFEGCRVAVFGDGGVVVTGPI
ncbi:hypothetical protein DQW50_07820 [Halorubrum sp. 48-1-W]|uniref:HalOD1 output domain-containing protein n=1 Tax=Halorubrum sp. 48-1-W TaxID=2249761 RepID=UPI000DCC4B9C|nr:HalOD1 output domain-containing protein [Halorubrum sp. 48-1-W]RAW45649.1 hypothetical protein DQW50_07820 [Halorubrum sp. 48-1-W]